jgi:hypothetical protein
MGRLSGKKCGKGKGRRIGDGGDSSAEAIWGVGLITTRTGLTLALASRPSRQVDGDCAWTEYLQILNFFSRSARW